MDFQRHGRHNGEGEERYGYGRPSEGRGFDGRYGDPEWQRTTSREGRAYGEEGQDYMNDESWQRPRGTQTGGSLYGQGRHWESSWRPGAESGNFGDARSAAYTGERDYGNTSDWREAGRFREDSRWNSRSRPSLGREQDYREQDFSRDGRFASFGSRPETFDTGRSYAGSDGRRSAGGPHAGKGPKGFMRSDERIKEQVSDRLEEHGDIDASEMSVSVKDGEVSLDGTVADRRMKRMAEELVEDSPGVKQVHNRLRVEKSNGNGSDIGGAFGKGKESQSDKANRTRSGL